LINPITHNLVSESQEIDRVLSLYPPTIEKR
jgi:hypothetical protein